MCKIHNCFLAGNLGKSFNLLGGNEMIKNDIMNLRYSLGLFHGISASSSLHQTDAASSVIRWCPDDGTSRPVFEMVGDINVSFLLGNWNVGNGSSGRVLLVVEFPSFTGRVS